MHHLTVFVVRVQTHVSVLLFGSHGITSCVVQAGLSSGDSEEEIASMITQIVGQIQLLSVVGCWNKVSIFFLGIGQGLPVALTCSSCFPSCLLLCSPIFMAALRIQLSLTSAFLLENGKTSPLLRTCDQVQSS